MKLFKTEPVLTITSIAAAIVAVCAIFHVVLDTSAVETILAVDRAAHRRRRGSGEGHSGQMTRKARFEVREAEDDAGFYYVLIAANGEVLSTSEMYSRREDANRAIGDALKADHEAAFDEAE